MRRSSLYFEVVRFVMQGPVQGIGQLRRAGGPRKARNIVRGERVSNGEERRPDLRRERFLFVRLGPQHLAIDYPYPKPDALVLEFESDQWVLYFYLAAEGKIE